jgi:hypothetical protein
MRYRSDVGIGMAFVNKAAAREFVLKVQACQPETVREALTEYSLVFGSSDSEPVMFLGHYEDVKWYPSYPAVQAHHHLLTLAEEAGAATRFVRTGEDIGDDEETDSSTGSGYTPLLHECLFDAIQITRRVSCDIPHGAFTPISLI